MTDGHLMALPTFWARNALSKTQYYYLRRLRRGPATISIGGKEVVSPAAEEAWRAETAANPVMGPLRKLVEEKEAADKRRENPRPFGPLASPRLFKAAGPEDAA